MLTVETTTDARQGGSAVDVVCELLELAALNLDVYNTNHSLVVLGRSRGYFMAARLVFDSLADDRTGFTFPRWQDLQDWMERRRADRGPRLIGDVVK